MKLHELPSPIKGKTSKRVGRGVGSGKGGHTVGRGSKGQRSRVGSSIPLWFEGGQLPLNKKLPYLRGKLRFSSLKHATVLLTLSRLNDLGLDQVSPDSLVQAGVLPRADRPVKIVATGAISRAVQVRGVRASATAKEAIEKAGGSVE